MTIVRTDLEIAELHLESGGHSSIEEGGCIMEYAAYLAGEPWGDRPQCVSPAIGAFCREWNDTLGDDDRNRLLKPFVTKVIGTRTTDEDETIRAWMACDWLVRVFTPAWLRRIGLDDDAWALEQLGELSSGELAQAAMPAIQKAQENARAAGAAAWDAAGAAAWAAAWAAARAAAGAAAGAAARAAAGAAAWDAAWDAAGDAAGDALKETTTALQDSAVELLDRMCAVGRTSEVASA
jgi:hypothetical protein